MLLDKTPLYPQRGSNTQPSERRVDALTTAPWQIISFGFVKWRVECLRSIFWYSNLHNTPDRFRTCCQKNHMWPGRDLNTQPSELESDALPLRHQACCLSRFFMRYYRLFKKTNENGWKRYIWLWYCKIWIIKEVFLRNTVFLICFSTKQQNFDIHKIKIYHISVCTRSYGVMVSTQDSESCDPSSNLGRTWPEFSNKNEFIDRYLWLVS